MSETPYFAGHGEPMRQPIAPVTVYTVTISSTTYGEEAVQEWREIVPAIPGQAKRGDVEAVPAVPAKMGYITSIRPSTKKHTLFEAVFATRPKVSDLATLMEGGTP